MTAPQSIADLLRQEIAITSSNSMQLSKALGLNQPSLWRFIHARVDPNLAAAELLLHHFGYVVVRERDAKAKGLPYIRPSAEQQSRRKEQRKRNAAARAKAAKPAKGAKNTPVKRAAPKRSSAERAAAKHPSRRTRQL